jgi:four helix bundle protein
MKPDRLKANGVGEKSYAFTLEMIRLAQQLRAQRDYELASQLLRCGTSIGANIEVAQCGISKADFTAKMGIASKEARETYYWLRLLRDSRTLPDNQVAPRLKEIEELIRILTAIVKTAQKSRVPKLNIQHSPLNIA